MYMIIRVIVDAKNEEEALKKGKDSLERFTGEGKHFDYYMTFDREGNEWKGNWCHLPPVVLASSPEGKHFIDVGWKYTVEGYMEALEYVKLAVQYLSPEEIMERRYPKDLPKDTKEKINVRSIRVYFDELGNQPGNPKFLYHEFEPIFCEEDLEFALTPKEGLNVYVIPAYVHY